MNMERENCINWDFLVLLACVLYILVFIGSMVGNNVFVHVIQVFGLLFISLVPGYLLFRLILTMDGVQQVEDIKLVLHSVGLSLFILEFLGFGLDLPYTILKLNTKPFSKIVLGPCFIILVFGLYTLNRKCVNNFYILKTINTKITIILIFLLLPIVSIFSMYLINFYNNSLLGLILIFIISLIPSLVILNVFSEKVMPILIYSVGLSLIIMNSMLGCLFRATDNMFEFELSCIHISNGFWNYNICSNLNAMLGVVMVIPMYNVLCDICLKNIFRLIIPLISSLIPVCLYTLYKEMVDHRIAFFSTFFFISIYEFYTWSGLTMKMVTAELFLALALLAIVDNDVTLRIKSILTIIYLSSIAVSHYGTAYILIFCLTCALLILITMRKINYLLKNSIIIVDHPEITLNLLIFFIVFTLSWYIYTASSSPFTTMVDIGNNLIKCLIGRNILPRGSYAYHIVVSSLPEYLQILKYLYMISAVLITVGLLKAIVLKIKNIKENKYNFSMLYLILSIFFYVSGGFVFLGSLSGTATPDRIYQIISVVLAPFCVIGGTAVINLFVKTNYKNLLKIFYLFLIIFLLFNTCFLAEVVWRYNIGPMVSISKPRILNNGNIYEREYLDRVSFVGYNIHSAVWLLKYKCSGVIYCGQNADKNVQIAKAIQILGNYWLNDKIVRIRALFMKTKVYKSSYIYLTKFNINTRTIKISGSILPKLLNLTKINAFKVSCRVYTNGGSVVYYSL